MNKEIKHSSLSLCKFFKKKKQLLEKGQDVPLLLLPAKQLGVRSRKGFSLLFLWSCIELPASWCALGNMGFVVGPNRGLQNMFKNCKSHVLAFSSESLWYYRRKQVGGCVTEIIREKSDREAGWSPAYYNDRAVNSLLPVAGVAGEGGGGGSVPQGTSRL